MKLSRFEREQEGLARAWSLLTTRSSGNSGKPGAMRYLHAYGQSLDGIDLSCRTMGGTRIQPDGTEECLRPTNLNNLSLSFDEFGEVAGLWDADLSGVSLVRADLTRAALVRADLSGSIIENSRFAHVIADRANFTGAILTGSDFSEGSFKLANFTDAEISSHFCGSSFTGAVMIGSNWHGRSAPESYFSGVNFSNSILYNYNFSGSDFSDWEGSVSFDEAIITDVSFQNASFRGASFRGARLNNVDFADANIALADFTEADLLGSTDLSRAWIFDDEEPPVGIPSNVEVLVRTRPAAALTSLNPVQYKAMTPGSFMLTTCFVAN